MSASQQLTAPEEEAQDKETEATTLFQVTWELSTESTTLPPDSSMETAMVGAVVNSPVGADASNTDGNSENTAQTAECDIGVEAGTPVPPSCVD